MTRYKTSGPLIYSEIKGLHHVDLDWSIEIGWPDSAFRLDDGSCLSMIGVLIARPGYLWDGSSGPTIDGAADPVPSLVHDLLYEAMRCRKLHTSMRGRADALYYSLLCERGMSRLRAGLRYVGLRLFGGGSASPSRGPEHPKRRAE